MAGIIALEASKAKKNEHAEEILFRVGDKLGYDLIGQRIGVSNPDGICPRCKPSIIERAMIPESKFGTKEYE